MIEIALKKEATYKGKIRLTLIKIWKIHESKNIQENIVKEGIQMLKEKIEVKSDKKKNIKNLN